MRATKLMAGLIAAGLLACGGSSDSVNGTQFNKSCDVPDTDMKGTAAAGASCSTYKDCAASCCTCTTGQGQWMAAACLGGKCADKTTTCSKTASDSTYCN